MLSADSAKIQGGHCQKNHDYPIGSIVHLASPPPATAFQSLQVIMETPIVSLIQAARLVLPIDKCPPCLAACSRKK